MTYLEYIDSLKIGNHPQGTFIAEIYPGKMDKLREIPNHSFQKCLSRLMNTSLTREFVRNSFRTDGAYTGFVATMLWGGLGMTTWRSLESAMTMDKSEVEQKISNLQNLLDGNMIQEAFMSLQESRDRNFPQNNKFEGIDISYFTKLLYFLYNGNLATPPIIFDKWGMYIHMGILISQNEHDILSRYYKYYNRNFHIKSNKETCYRYNVYADYLKRMSMLSTKYGLSHPGDLEEFLFGKKLKHREDKNNDNPRFFVKNYVEGYYDKGRP